MRTGQCLFPTDMKCFVCGSTLDIHRHHIFSGTANRKRSEQFGCWCYLCARHHNMSDEGVHFNRELDLKLKRMAQQAWERNYGTREEFIATFGKSWL